MKVRLCQAFKQGRAGIEGRPGSTACLQLLKLGKSILLVHPGQLSLLGGFTYDDQTHMTENRKTEGSSVLRDKTKLLQGSWRSHVP